MIYKYSDFILENIEQTEYIDFKKTNMEDDFNELNNLMFDNKVQPIGLNWFKNKSKLGLMTTIGNNVVDIKISTFYKMTRKQYLEVLAHEMIHGFITQQNIRDNGHHGREFMKILNELNRKHNDFNITPTEDASYFTVNNSIKKPIGAILFVHNETEYSCIFVNKSLIDNTDSLNTFVDSLFLYIERTPNNIFVKDKTLSIEFYKCDNPELSKFKVKRNLNLNNLQFFDINDGNLMKIREGELFNTIKLK